MKETNYKKIKLISMQDIVNAHMVTIERYFPKEKDQCINLIK